ncbi:hypothetical protein [Gemella sanguinis]|uniref:hypothetical protein n=1 Tax=Gemella sanguinis TaxID=84135 RepID=UPI000807650E|nr:hypothetical protein [Gemella sanguinis]
MNKEELLKEFNEKVEQLRDEFISKLEDDKKEFELTYPEDGASVYFIHRGDKSVTDSYFLNDRTIDKNIFEIGEYFNTKEEAEQCLRERELLFKLRQWAKEKNDGWKPDWSNDDEEKYYITYFKDKSLGVSWEITWGMINFTKLPYFKTSEITQECIKLFENEIKEVLANG